MTYSFACGDVVPGCPATFTATDTAQLRNDVAAHASAKHGLESLPEPLVARLNALSPSAGG